MRRAGYSRRKVLQERPKAIELLTATKREFDPKGLLNPGKKL